MKFNFQNTLKLLKNYFATNKKNFAILKKITKSKLIKKLLIATFAISLIIVALTPTDPGRVLHPISDNIKNIALPKLTNLPSRINVDEEVNTNQVNLKTNKNKEKQKNINLPQNQSPLNIQPDDSWKSITIKSGDNLSEIFDKFNLSNKELHSILQANPKANLLAEIKPGQTLKFLLKQQNDSQLIETNRLRALHLEIEPTKTLSIENIGDQYKFNFIKKEIEIAHKYGEGIIEDSLFSSGTKAGLRQSVLVNLVNIFRWDIDFALDIRRGDSFKVLFEEKYINGKYIGTGDIIAAEFVNNGEKFQAVLHQDKYGHNNYYSPDGFSMQKAFIRTPVKFTRISSKFNPGRRHPILHKIRAHRGVDYAAPTGTPVKAAGNGRVEFVGRKGGYGKVIILKHAGKYTTLYGHLSRFNKRTKKGAYVKQGQVIGYVGKTGLASGPHLHYEFRIHGIHKDPLKVKLPKSNPIPKAEREKFKAFADKTLALMESHGKSYLAQND